MSESSSSSLSSSSEAPDSCLDGARRILIQPYFQKYFVANRTDGFRLKLVAETACQMPTEIFRFMRHPPDVNGVTNDEFTGVCSSPDLEEIPIDEPRSTDNPPVFRSDTVDLLFESQQRAEAALALILAEILSLKETLDAGDVLEAQTPVWIGGAP